MIEVSVEPRRLVAGRRTQLAVRFTNRGRRACSDIVFKLRLPSAIALIGGTNRTEIPVIPPGHVHTHEVTVEPARPGEFQLSSSNFSYRDEFDAPVRVTDFHARLSVEAAPSARPVPARPVGRLGVEHPGGELALGEWDVLPILVRNETGVPLSDVTVAVSGPFKTDGKRARIAVLGDGATARFPFKVNAAEGGRHVPVSVHTTYSYADGLGSVRGGTQEDSLDVVVKPGRTNTQPPPPNGDVGEQTILYLAASPLDLERLRSDLEMRKVKERLQLSRHRGRYRIEPCVAVRLVDISQALVDYEPQVVHFSGHGDEDGNLYVEDEQGNSSSLTPEGLAKLFGLHKATIQCVIVNACYSMRLARAMARHIDYVVGMRCQIGDEAAILFSVGFYLGLFAGQSVPDAFSRGCAHIQADRAAELEHQTPVLVRSPGPGPQDRRTSADERVDMTAAGKLAAAVSFHPSIADDDRQRFEEALTGLGLDVHARSAPRRRGGAGELTAVILITLPLQAFLAALGGKLADDAYAAFKRVVRTLLDRGQAGPATPTAMVLQDPRTSLLIQIDRGMPEGAWNQLHELDLSAFRYGPILYDRARRQWRSELDEAGF